MLANLNEDEDDLLPEDLPSKPHGHRSQDIVGKRDKKLLINAKDIASTSSWVISQLKDRFTEAKDGKFHFDSFKINELEKAWYSKRTTAKGVLSILAQNYATAPEWEPLPKSLLSPCDLDLIEKRQREHLQKLHRAEEISRRLIVRLAHDASEEQHLVEYGKGSTQWIQERLQSKRNSSKSDKVPKLNVPQSSLFYYCDVASCNSVIPAIFLGCCKDNSTCKVYRFCPIHTAHFSHSENIQKRHKRVKFVTSNSSDANIARQLIAPQSIMDNDISEDNSVCRCDIEECIEVAIVNSIPCEHQACNQYRFCLMHTPHDSHSGQGHVKRSRRVAFPDDTSVSNKLSRTAVDQAPIQSSSIGKAMTSSVTPSSSLIELSTEIIENTTSNDDAFSLRTTYVAINKQEISMIRTVDDHINRYLNNQRGFNIHICMSDSLSISYYKDCLQNLRYIYNVDLTSSGIDIDLSSKSKKVVFINTFTDALINSLK